MQVLVIALASFFGILYLWVIRSFDIYEKEPFFRLLLTAITGGSLAIIISLILYEFVTVRQTFTDAIIKVGLIEESSKFLALLLLYKLIRKDFDEIVDGIIYITAISLGFSIIENIKYASGAHYSIYILTVRSVISVLGHISFSGYIGIAFYIHKKIRKNYAGILLAICLASLAHGLYDGVLFQKELTAYFKLVFWGLLFFQVWLLKTVLGFSDFRRTLSKSVFHETDEKIFCYCCRCNKTFISNEYRFWKIKAGFCDSCNNFTVDAGNLINLIKYSRPVLNAKRYVKRLSGTMKNIALDKADKILFNYNRGFMSADINDLSDWLNESNKQDKIRMLNKPVVGFLLRNLGLKYIMKKPDC